MQNSCPSQNAAQRVAPSPPPPPAAPPATVQVPRVSVPISWFRKPLIKTLKKLVRPAVATTRRKEITIKMSVPREIFEDLLAPVKDGEITGLTRDASSGLLEPTRKTSALRHYEYTVRRGSMTDKILNFGAMEQDEPLPPPPAPVPSATATMLEVDEIGVGDVYEVEAIVGKRVKGKRTQYNIKWQGWPASTNTWEVAGRIHPDIVRNYEGKAPRKQRVSAPSQFKRGAGCARAQLSTAAQKRGGVPQSISMVCGNLLLKLKESVTEESMPTITITMFVLTMSKTGHITWPTTFDLLTKAALRVQARALLKKMIDDPLNPVDASMEPALTAKGTSSVWQGAPMRQLVVVQPVVG